MPKEYIGPKAQAAVPDEDWEVINGLVRDTALTQAEALRYLVAIGAQEVRSRALGYQVAESVRAAVERRAAEAEVL